MNTINNLNPMNIFRPKKKPSKHSLILNKIFEFLSIIIVLSNLLYPLLFVMTDIRDFVIKESSPEKQKFNRMKLYTIYFVINLITVIIWWIYKIDKELFFFPFIFIFIGWPIIIHKLNYG